MTQLNATTCSVTEHAPRHNEASGTRGRNLPPSMSPGRLVLADDDVLLREGVASLLGNAGYEIAGQAGDAAGLIDLVREHRPELAVIDIRMPPSHTTEGLEAARAIRNDFPEVGILLLSAQVEVEA